MKILLYAPLFAEGCTVLLVAQALSNLGHSVIFWNSSIKRPKPTEDYDFAIVWTNNPISREDFNKPVAYMYLDDPIYWLNARPIMLPENACKNFEFVFTNNVWDNMPENYIWLPMGCCPLDVHRVIPFNEGEKEKYYSDVVFIGTNRGKRAELCEYINNNLDKKYSFKVYGNNWDYDNSPFMNSKPVYFHMQSKIVGNAKIVITEHFYSAFSTNDVEKPAIGGALTITDHPLVKQMYPMMPIYKDYKEAVEIAHYYLEHEEERIKLVKEIQQIAYKKYSYELQLNNMINYCLDKISGKEVKVSKIRAEINK